MMARVFGVVMLCLVIGSLSMREDVEVGRVAQVVAKYNRLSRKMPKAGRVAQVVARFNRLGANATGGKEKQDVDTETDLSVEQPPKPMVKQAAEVAEEKSAEEVSTTAEKEDSSSSQTHHHVATERSVKWSRSESSSFEEGEFALRDGLKVRVVRAFLRGKNGEFEKFVVQREDSKSRVTSELVVDIKTLRRWRELAKTGRVAEIIAQFEKLARKSGGQ